MRRLRSPEKIKSAFEKRLRFVIKHNTIQLMVITKYGIYCCIENNPTEPLIFWFDKCYNHQEWMVHPLHIYQNLQSFQGFQNAILKNHQEIAKLELEISLLYTTRQWLFEHHLIGFPEITLSDEKNKIIL